MLRYDLIHPPLLRAVAALGHGSQILLADSNYPAQTARHPRSELIHLNVAPGLITATDLLPILQSAVVFESASVMAAPPEIPVPIHEDYERLLGASVPVDKLERFAFYEASRSADVGLVVATGEARIYANLLLTIGVHQSGVGLRTEPPTTR